MFRRFVAPVLRAAGDRSKGSSVIADAVCLLACLLAKTWKALLTSGDGEIKYFFIEAQVSSKARSNSGVWTFTNDSGKHLSKFAVNLIRGPTMISCR